MNGVKRYNTQIIRESIAGEYIVGNAIDVVLASDYDRLEQEFGQMRRDNAQLTFALSQEQQAYIASRAERDAALKQVDRLRQALEKISAYAPCSGVKDPGFTKMYMGILARDAIAALQAKP